MLQHTTGEEEAPKEAIRAKIARISFSTFRLLFRHSLLLPFCLDLSQVFNGYGAGRF